MASITWDSSFNLSPTVADRVRNTPVFIQQSRAAVQERLAVEHCLDLTDGGGQTDHGKHLRGSARAFVSDTSVADPTTVTADDGNYSTGRLQVYPTLKRLGYYSGSAWVDLIRNSSGQLFSEVATGTAPIVVASTTKVTNLNADQVDGYSPGNSSGNIPISNGVLNSNLNAERISGNLAVDDRIAYGVVVKNSGSLAIRTSLALEYYIRDSSIKGDNIYDAIISYNMKEGYSYIVSGCIQNIETPDKTLIIDSMRVSASGVTFFGAFLTVVGSIVTTTPGSVSCTNGSDVHYSINLAM